jgi:hypothetical protein
MKMTTYHSNQVPTIKEIGGVEYEFIYNSKGTLIKKCCASCKYKQPKDSEGPQRICTHTPDNPQTVDKRDCCESWYISDEADRVKTACSRRKEKSDDETSK